MSIKKPLYFCHVPRTGGTTISHILNSCFDCLKVSSRTLPDITTECLHGHFDYNSYKLGTWITFIREPHTRLESLYNHYLHYNPNLSPIVFLDMVGTNPMTRQLNNGKFDFIGIFEHFADEVMRLGEFLDINIGIPRHNHLTVAKVPLEIPAAFLEKDLIYYDDILTNQ